MPGFISRAACRGRRPLSHTAYEGNARSALAMRLLADRSVARFIIAPAGYGKSSLALEYAETMFAWTHVFWVNGASPCFIRDLDEGSIASQCLEADAQASLVVFEDAPALAAERTQRFSDEIDALLARGCEVVVTCTPGSSMAAALQPDCIRVNALDLLLDNDELDACRSADERARRAVDAIGAALRIPAIAWSADDGDIAAFVRESLREEVPLDLLMVMASVFVLQRGTFSDLRAIARIEPAAIADFVADYPHLGFDGDLETFEAPPVSIDALAGPLKKRMEDLTQRSSHGSARELVWAWARLLLEKGAAPRACDLVREVSLRRDRGSWVVDNGYELVRQACFFPALRIMGDRDASRGETRMRASALEGLVRMVCGDEDGALRCAKRHAFDQAAPYDVRALSLLIMVRGNQLALYERASNELRQLEAPSEDAMVRRMPMWRLLVGAWLAGTQGTVSLARFWSAEREKGADADGLCICASWLFGGLGGAVGDEYGESSPPAMSAVASAESYVRERLSALGDEGLDYYAASAGLSMEQAHMRGVRYEGGPLEASVLIRLRQVEMSILAQRQALDEAAEASRARQGGWAAAHPGALAGREGVRPQARRKVVPILTVRLFGHFEVMMGDEPLDQSRFRRSCIRSLLVLLAVNQGRDLSRETLASSLWPRSPEEVARKNFYSAWSQLRRALTLPDGTCPYLLRHQFGCSLEPRYVQSDAARLNEICRELMFGVPNIEHWAALFSEIDSSFGSELMPAERRNPLITQARNDYRGRLVDALVSATFSAIGIDSPQWGIWFARSAVNHDDTREDAYAALMRAQIASNQRTAAMSTYLQCRHVLANKLGIDPSSEITRLYESLLDAE